MEVLLFINNSSQACLQVEFRVASVEKGQQVSLQLPFLLPLPLGCAAGACAWACGAESRIRHEVEVARSAPPPSVAGTPGYLENQSLGSIFPARFRIQSHPYALGLGQAQLFISCCHRCRWHSGLFYRSHNGFEGSGGLVLVPDPASSRMLVYVILRIVFFEE